ncbi:MAG TPA: MarR family winged helix-turn-helix transcriptional regulator [Vicinamibacteria bacterium]|nr:MarR family winged helix-turn-helix transcriptional regulator [Vicinamibacteria bacterium]
MFKQDPLGRLIGAARRRLKQAVGRRVSRYGLSSQQFWVLIHLDDTDEPALSRVCAVLRIDPPTASRIVAALTRRGLVRAVPDPADRRRARLKLTADGRALARRLQPLATEVRAAVERDLTRHESVELRRLLNKVITGLDRYDLEGVSP